DKVFSSSDCNCVWLSFRDTLLESARKSIPLKKKRNLVRGVPCSGEVKRAWRARKRIFKRCQGVSSPFAEELRRSADFRLSSALECARRRFETTVGSKAKSDPKLFWSMIRGRIACKPSLQYVLNPNASPTSCDLETADVMNDYFSSVFTRESSNVLSDMHLPASIACDFSLSDVFVATDDVSKVLKQLPNNSSPGPDGIAYPLLKYGGQNFVQQCARLFNFLLDKSFVPDEWKCGIIVPVYKGKGSKVECKSYRPISLTCVFSKVLERLLKTVITNHLISNNLLNSSQHGFLARRSCLTNLLSFFETLTDAVDQKLCADVVYLDFSRAFDTIPHKRLLLKLESFGIQGKLHAWISSFLCDRTQCVSIRGIQSSRSPVLSGVPQGSVLGPLLFLMYVNDLDDVVFSSNILKFADDTKLFTLFDPHVVAPQCSPINDDLNRIFKWCETWCLKLNMEKCMCMHIGSTNPCLPVCVSGNQLSPVSSVRDLGVYISNDLKPSLQCMKAVSKGHRMLSVIKLCFKHLDVSVLVRLYKAFVRPVLEYCSVAWCPYYVKDIDALEKVQRRMSRILPQLRQMDYEERLSHLRISSLKLRRLRYDLLCAFKIVNNDVNLSFENFFTFSHSVDSERSVSTRGTSERSFYVRHCRLNVRKFWFSQRVIPFWNALPPACKKAECFEIFKRELDTFLSSRNDLTTL
ncbi:MAG: reverse transcriptase family protein, partial [Pseudomonadota bacterium]